MLVKGLCFFLFLNLASQALGQEGTRCYGVDCPSYTSNCKKEIITSADKHTLKTTISCLDDSNSVLLDHHSQEPNTIGSNTYFRSTTYSNVEGIRSYRRPVLDVDRFSGIDGQYNNIENFM
ncbi:unnamed protein product [Brassicogethes aeneus]|uniref:Uncharacterized protein n=1 Tax=Brassicogethes aeneus TaxID=1431903 RepID=A0A9P0AVC8_BRAAE|nr:unnamed protein product [Brassicogethes aeneus]